MQCAATHAGGRRIRITLIRRRPAPWAGEFSTTDPTNRNSGSKFMCREKTILFSPRVNLSLKCQPRQCEQLKRTSDGIKLCSDTVPQKTWKGVYCFWSLILELPMFPFDSDEIVLVLHSAAMSERLTLGQRLKTEVDDKLLAHWNLIALGSMISFCIQKNIERYSASKAV